MQYAQTPFFRVPVRKVDWPSLWRKQAGRDLGTNWLMVHNVRGATPQSVETSHTAGKVFFTVATIPD
jgi:hypothetical protein